MKARFTIEFVMDFPTGTPHYAAEGVVKTLSEQIEHYGQAIIKLEEEKASKDKQLHLPLQGSMLKTVKETK